MTNPTIRAIRDAANGRVWHRLRSDGVRSGVVSVCGIGMPARFWEFRDGEAYNCRKCEKRIVRRDACKEIPPADYPTDTKSPAAWCRKCEWPWGEHGQKDPPMGKDGTSCQ